LFLRHGRHERISATHAQFVAYLLVLDGLVFH